MAAIPVQTISLTGLSRAAATAAGATGDTVANNGNMHIIVTDTGTTAPTVTIISQTACNQDETHDIEVSIPSGESRVIGPFPPSRFNTAAGVIEVSYSSETDVTIEAYTY